MSTVIKKGSTKDFFERARSIARAADRGEPIAKSPKVITLEPESFQALLSANRLKVLREVRKTNGVTLARLSENLNRERAALSRDVKALELIGLLVTRLEKNPGHGLQKIVEPVAKKGEKLILQTEL